MTRDTSLHYVQRINRALDCIVRNLEQSLKLEDIARVAHFSPFHFHRIFQALIGETPGQLVKRLRLERALWQLSHRRRRSLTEIGLVCGFASLSDFSRCFKERYGVSPGAFDLQAFRSRGREELDAAMLGPKERRQLECLPAKNNPDCFQVRLRQLPARCVAYLRVLDPYRPGVVVHAAQRMVTWAEKRHLAGGQWLGYQWDNPEIVALKDCRYDVGLEVPDIAPKGEIGRFEFPAMLVAEVEVRCSIDLELRALDWLYGAWLPTSGYVPMDQPCFEAWIGRPFQHGNEHFELSVQIPVERGPSGDRKGVRTP
jgi:AraC family transcriptional regulator